MFETERLILRQWWDSDLESWAALNSDPEVMKYFERPLSQEESTSLAEKIIEKLEKNGYGLWALQVKGGDDFIGFLGISDQDFGFSNGPIKEIGWRLTKSSWGHGYATEAAAEVLQWGVQQFDQIYSVTAKGNLKSRAVMERIGLTYRPEMDFRHPRVTREELIEHVVYSYKA